MRFVSLAILLLARVASSTSVVAASTQLRKSAGSTFISTLKFQVKLRICNAYPYSYPMDVYLGKEKVTESSLAYKSCAELNPNLKAGDKLDFKVRDSSAGSFSVNELPQNDAVLVLVIYRHDTLSTAVSFESHVFANLLNAQVAVIDTYKGSAKATTKIQDKSAGDKARKEDLRYDSVVAVNPGEYEVVLEGSDGKKASASDLVALNRESYVLMRVGVEAQSGQQYPQELVIYPKSDPSALHSAATPMKVSLAVFAALLLCLQ